MDWDPQGRLWVVEMPGFVPDLQAPEPFMEPDRQGGRARRHEPRRQDGQAHGLRRRPGAGAIAEGPRRRRPRRRAAERLADEGHEWRSQDGQEGARDRHLWPARGAGRAERQRVLLGPRQLDVHRGQRCPPAVQGRQVRGAQDAHPRRVGRHARRRGRIYRNTNESVLHADLVPTQYLHAQSESAADARQLRASCGRSERREHRSGRCGPTREPTARISSASIARTARSRSSRRSARR